MSDTEENKVMAHEEEAPLVLAQVEMQEDAVVDASAKTVGADPQSADPYAQLYLAVKKCGRSATEIGNLVEKWFETYEKDPKLAVGQISGLVLLSCGCTNVAFPEESRNEDGELSRKPDQMLSDIVARDENTVGMNKRASATGAKYDLLNPHFNAVYGKFMEKLVLRAQRGMLYTECFEDIQTWMTMLSTGRYKSIRHTATTGVFNIMTGLISVYQSLEKQKKSKSQEEKLNDVREYLGTLWGNVFTSRFRDVEVELRYTCVEAILEWIQMMPEYFLESKKTKYVGWMLFDHQPIIREGALRIILKALKVHPDDELKSWVKRIKKNIIRSIQDKRTSVAQHAMRLLTYMLSLQLLEGEEIEELMAVIFDNRAYLRVEGGKFFRNFLREEHVEGANSSKANTNKKRLELILNFMECYAFQDIPIYVVDALWEAGVGCLYDWSTVCATLERYTKHSSSARAKRREEDDDETHKDVHALGLVHGILCKLANNFQIVADKEEHPLVEPKKARISEEARKMALRLMSEHLVASLPDLIANYQADPEQVIVLTGIVRNMNIAEFGERGLEVTFVNLLDVLVNLYFKHEDENAIIAQAQMWMHLLDEDYPLKTKTREKFWGLVERLEGYLNECMTNLRSAEARDSISTYAEVSARAAWTRVHALWHTGNLSEKFWPAVVNATTVSVDRPAVPLYLPEAFGCIEADIYIKIGVMHQEGLDVEVKKQTEYEFSKMIPDCQAAMRSAVNLLQRVAARAPSGQAHVVRLMTVMADIATLVQRGEKQRLMVLIPEHVDVITKMAAEAIVKSSVRDPVLDRADDNQHPDKKFRLRSHQGSHLLQSISHIVPPDSPAAARVLSLMGRVQPNDAAYIRNVRTLVWREKLDGKKDWDMEWRAIKYAFEDHLAVRAKAANETDEQVSAASFDALTTKLAAAHFPWALHYKQAGCVHHILCEALYYVMGSTHNKQEDLLQRYSLLKYMQHYARKLLPAECKSVLSEYARLEYGLDRDSYGTGVDQVLSDFKAAVNRSTKVTEPPKGEAGEGGDDAATPAAASGATADTAQEGRPAEGMELDRGAEDEFGFGTQDISSQNFALTQPRAGARRSSPTPTPQSDAGTTSTTAVAAKAGTKKGKKRSRSPVSEGSGASGEAGGWRSGRKKFQ